MRTRTTAIILLLWACGAAAAGSLEDLKAGSGARFAEGPSETDRAVGGAVDAADRPLFDAIAGGDGAALQKEVRRGEAALLQKTLDESPLLKKAFAGAEKDRTWADYYQDRRMDAAVASWSSNLKAGYYAGTAAAYATWKTAPPVVDAVAGGALWAVGVVYGLGLGLLASALTGHL
ncbi:MAG: hypothetical protein HY079_01550 [Elusimicrobia bacterium]|nr:hypothetical protein [Elusimicrobiota bacterium]